MTSFTPQTPTTSSSLILRIQQLDQEAWVRLEFVYKPLLVFWCDQNKISDNDVEDILQNIYQTVHRYIGDFKKFHGKVCFRRWLKKIATSRISDFKLKNKDNPIPLSETSLELIRYAFASKSPEIEDEEEEKNERQILYQQILELIKSEVNESTWEYFWQTTVAGRNSFDVAAAMNTTAANVRQAKRNIKRRIIEEFEDLL